MLSLNKRRRMIQKSSIFTRTVFKYKILFWNYLWVSLLVRNPCMHSGWTFLLLRFIDNCILYLTNMNRSFRHKFLTYIIKSGEWFKNIWKWFFFLERFLNINVSFVIMHEIQTKISYPWKYINIYLYIKINLQYVY